MKKIMYAILAVPILAALVAGIAFFPTSFGATSIVASQQPAQTNTQALEQENEGVGEQEEEEIGAEADEEESIDPNLVNQGMITANEAKDIASNHLSIQPSAVQSIELEKEGGQLIYSVELTKDNHSIEVEVDAITGKVVDVEQDDD
jgi:uncharacterized membrane protein YkoI